MKTGIMVVAIAIALVATAQTAMAGEGFMCVGHVLYENGMEFPHGAQVEMWNQDHPEYEGQPWMEVTEWTPPPSAPYDYGESGEYGSLDDLIRVRVTSPDGSYVGENISRWGDVYIGPTAKIEMNITMYPVPVETENFTKSLPAGWNLVSLPLTPLDNGTSAVLGNDTIAHDAVKQYNAATHQFEDATTMDPGVGYFVHVTTAGTWRYEGTAYDSINVSLSQGLNMVGWTNETGSALPGALSSIDGSYRYVAHWDASSQSYEVYLPGAPVVFNDFTTMDRGEGYFIAATSSCTLVYP